MENTFDPELNSDPNIFYYVIDTKIGDVTGDSIPDEVSLLGIQPSGSKGDNYFDDITLRVVDGETKKTTYLRFRYNAGFSPKITLGDFTGNSTNDIFISINENPSTRTYFYYLFSFIDSSPQSLFNFIDFNNFSQYNVNFKDYYEVQISGINSNKEFLLNLGTKDDSYLSKFYKPNGKLLHDVSGSVLPLGNLFPIDINDDNILELLAIQRIVSNNPNDTIGYIQTFLSFNGTSFVPGLIMLATTGKNI